jgi:hypothetical protein
MYGLDWAQAQEQESMKSNPFEGGPLSALDMPEKYGFPVVTKLRKSTDKLVVPANTYDIVREGDPHMADSRDFLFKGGVSERYKVLLNQDIVNVVRQAIIELDMDVRNMDVKHFFSSDGGRWRCTITFKNIVIEPKVGDVIAHGITLYNSYNLTWMYQQLVEAYRLWCKNGCSSREASQNTRKKHTTNISVEGEGQKIANGLEAFFESEGQYQRWMAIKPNHITVQELFSVTLAHTLKSGISGVNKTLRDFLMTEYHSSSDNSLWGIYNVATAWATHLQGRTRGSSWAPQTQRTRHNSVSAMLNSPMWKELEHA